MNSYALAGWKTFGCDGTYRKWVPASVNRNTMQQSCRSAWECDHSAE